MKMTKRLVSIMLTLAVITVFCLPALGAQITWDPSDVKENVIYKANFDNDGSSAVSGGSLDTTTFASDPDHKNVTSSTGFLYAAGSGVVGGHLTPTSKITVQFDYYATTSDQLRVELRGVAGTEETGSGQQKHWDASQDLPSMQVESGKWQTFKGTIDMAKYYPWLESKNATVNLNGAYILIRLNNGGQLYTDNYKITGESTIIPLSPAISFNYAPNLTPVSSEDPIAAGHENVYKTSLTTGTQINVLSSTVAKDFFRDNATYRLSITYMQAEPAGSSVTSTNLDLLRFKNSKGTVVNCFSPGLNMYLDNANVNTWRTYTRTFTIDPASGDYTAKTGPLVSDGTFTMTIQSRQDAQDFYIADLKLVREPEISPNSNTVAFDEEQEVSAGQYLKVAAEGYFDETVAPKVVVGSTTFTGVWTNVVKNDKYRTAVAEFEDMTADKFDTFKDQQDGNFVITDIWGGEKTNPISVIFTTNVTNRVEVLTGSWKTLQTVAKEQTVTNSITWCDVQHVEDKFASGNAMFRLTYEAKGVSGTDYTGMASRGIAFRTGSGGEVQAFLDPAKLTTGEYSTYEAIADVGGMDRYYGTTDRSGVGFNVVLRGTADYPVTYKNIKVEYFDPDAEAKDYVVARLKVKNNVEGSTFSPKGLVMLAAYDGSQLVELSYKAIEYKDNGNLKNGVSGNETKYVYLTGKENGGEHNSVMSGLKAYDPSYTYRAFYWNNFGDMTPIAPMNELK